MIRIRDEITRVFLEFSSDLSVGRQAFIQDWSDVNRNLIVTVPTSWTKLRTLTLRAQVSESVDRLFNSGVYIGCL